LLVAFYRKSEAIVIAVGTVALVLFTFGAFRVIDAQHSDDGFPSANAGLAEETSFILDNTKVTLQRIASELGGHRRYLKVEAGNGQRTRTELASDPGGWAHFDICETQLGDIALLNTSPQSERNQAYLVRLGQVPRVVKAELPQVQCGRSIGTFDDGPDQQYAFQAVSPDEPQ
jgi:hypothetical protein